MSGTANRPLDTPRDLRTDRPHGYSGNVVSITVTDPCTITHPDQSREVFPVGTYEVPVEVANLPYFKYHTNNPPPPAPNPGTPEHAEMLRQESVAMMSRARLSAEQNAMAAAGVDRANAEVQFRAQMTNQIREEMRAELTPMIRAEVADSVRAEVEAEVRNEIAEEMNKTAPKKTK